MTDAERRHARRSRGHAMSHGECPRAQVRLMADRAPSPIAKPRH